MANELTRSQTGSPTLYALIRRVADGYVWNGSAFVAFVDADIADYDIPLTSQGGDLYAADFPADIEAGNYLIQYYLQSGASPSTNDLASGTAEKVYWNGVTTSEPVEGYAGRYTDADEVTNFLGTLNVAVYGDVNADGALDDAAMEQSIRTAESRATLYGGRVAAFAETDEGTEAAALWNAAAYKLASYELAAKRGFSGLNESAFEKLRDEAIADLREFKADPYGVDEVDDETPDAGTFRFVTIDRGNCDSDEYSSDY